jgi:hypothetical protein
VPDVVVFFADGEANQPRYDQPCSYANDRASSAKTAGVLVFSIGYGAGGARCQQDTSGAFANAWATTFLARVASETLPGVPSTDNSPGGCDTVADPQTENTDADFYYCESRGTDLEATFRRIAVQSIQRTRLLNF